ncbi:MAG: hypothetical protein GF331_25030 [Chitinivibrionales bacterium]|nr:hypothetical protein [Chitinivibrionales bacterium]
MRINIVHVIACVAVSACSCFALGPMIEQGDRLLFVGNSFMGRHTGDQGGIDEFVTAVLQTAEPPVDIDAQAIIYGGTGLGSMFTSLVQNAIRTMNFDYVIIVRGSDSDMMRFYNLCREVGSKLIIYAFWARNPAIDDGLETYERKTNQITRDMRDFEEQTNGDVLIAPIAQAYAKMLLNPPKDGLRMDYLYQEDNIHENELGHILSSYVFYSLFLARSPIGAPYYDKPRQVVDGYLTFTQMAYDDTMRLAVQTAAWEAYTEWYGEPSVAVTTPLAVHQGRDGAPGRAPDGGFSLLGQAAPRTTRHAAAGYRLQDGRLTPVGVR